MFCKKTGFGEKFIEQNPRQSPIVIKKNNESTENWSDFKKCSRITEQVYAAYAQIVALI